VVDPVMVATSGDALLQPAAVAAYRGRLFPRATLVTPNMAEAAALTGKPVRNLEEMRAAGTDLAQEFATQILDQGRAPRRRARDRFALRRNPGAGVFGAVRRRRLNSRHWVYLFRGDRRSPRLRRFA
jgi:hydroxymethylpyrimidine/phosphomethylpyrimidine kinase